MSKEQINLSDALNEINSIKTDLGTALNNKGMTVTQEFSSYPTAVTNQSTRTLQFPCNQIETYQFMIGTGLSSANIELDSISSGTAQFGQIYKYENSIVSRIAKDSNRDISIVALNTPDIDYTGQLGTYNENAATIRLAGQNANFNFKIVPVEAGWVQFKVTDASNVKNYYINAVVENFDPKLITCYDTRTWYGYADYMEVAANSLQQGQKYVFMPAGNYNRVSNNNENINSVKFTNVDPYLPYRNMTDLTAMQALYPTLDHMTVEADDPTMVTITNEMYSETQQNEYIVECVGYGSNNITFTYYDDQDTKIYSWSFYIEIAQAEPTEYFIRDGNIMMCTVSYDKNPAAKGDTVTITVTPQPDETISTVRVQGHNSAVEYSVTSIGNNQYTFEMPGEDVEVHAY